MKPIVLAILDGLGYREEEKGNAVKYANTKTLDYMFSKYPYSLLDASEEDVGLPKGQMGNSEVGHLNIGAGRIVYQPLSLIDKKIRDGELYKSNLMLEMINHIKKNGSKLHLMGLVSDGGVHSHINHLFALLDMCKKENIQNVYIHVITDGRDTMPDDALKYIRMLEEKINKIGVGHIASISGRFYAMDRDNRWDRVKKYYDAIVYGEPNQKISINSFVENSFKNEIYDEFIEPCLLNQDGLIEDKDGLIFFNFRSDRANQILMSFANKDFDKFDTKKFDNLMIISMMPVANYVNARPIFRLEEIYNTFGEYVSKLGYSQLRIAETEKYNHVTYFFDGNKNVDYNKENKILIPSPKVATYDLKPEMSCNEITDTLLKELNKKSYDFVILNFANCDMVGHTGNFDATIKAVENVDYNLGRIYEEVKKLGGLLIVTSDHGNAEYMIDTNDDEVTAHSKSKVPLIVCDKNYIVEDGKLGDIAPSILSINNINIPKEMTGNIIINKLWFNNNSQFLIYINFIFNGNCI